MSHSFDFSRWALLVAKHWSENRKRYLLSLLAIAGLLVGFYSFIILATHRTIRTNIQSITYFFGLFLAGCLFASTTFDELSTAPKGIGYLMLPASHLEKFLCHIFYTVLIFFLSYTLIFYLIDIPMVHLSESIDRKWNSYLNVKDDLFVPARVMNIFSNRDEMKVVPIPLDLNTYFLISYFIAQAAFILGSVYFSKYSFIKTTICLFALYFFIFIYFGLILSRMVPQHAVYETLTSWRLNVADATSYVFLPGWADDVFYFTMKYVFTLVFLVIAYFRLKEKEI